MSRLTVRLCAALLCAMLIIALCGCEERNVESGDTLRSLRSDLKILCYGDSITAGIFEYNPLTYSFVLDQPEAFPAKLDALLEEKYGRSVDVVNNGIPGHTAAGALNDIEDAVKAAFEGALPDIIIVSLGFNDASVCTGEEFESDLGALLDRIALLAPDAHIMFMTQNMPATYVHENAVDKKRAEQNVRLFESGRYDDIIEGGRRACESRSVEVCDAYAYWRGLYDSGEDVTVLLSSYMTHPTREMQDVFASLLLEALEQSGWIFE